jgi:hypothetical protein
VISLRAAATEFARDEQLAEKRQEPVDAVALAGCFRFRRAGTPTGGGGAE